MIKLKKHNPRNDDRKDSKTEVLYNIEKVFNARIDIIKGFRDGIFLIRPETEKQKTGMSEPESDNEQPKKVPEWIKNSNGAFKMLDLLLTFFFNYLPLQEFLQSIFDGRFNNAKKAREYYTTNIYKNYEIKMNNVYTPAAEEMKDIFKQVKKILHHQFMLTKRTQTDSESEKLDIAQGGKSESDECNNNKFKIFAPTWNDEFNLPDGSYSVSDIQDYFQYIIKKMILLQIILLYKFM